MPFSSPSVYHEKHLQIHTSQSPDVSLECHPHGGRTPCQEFPGVGLECHPHLIGIARSEFWGMVDRMKGGVR